MSVNDDEIPAGWYPDPEGKPASRYWDGTEWTDRTRPQVGAPTPSTQAAQSAVPFGPAGYCRADDSFRGDLRQVVQYAVQAVQNLRWVVVNANELTQSVTFETKMSWGSWSGVTCTLSFSEVSPGVWRVTGSGKQNVRGGQIVAMDFGESGAKARKAIVEMKRLAPAVAG